MPRKSTSGKRSRGVPSKVANVECTAFDEQMAAGKVPSFDSPVDLLVVSYRVRLAYPYGVSAKAAIDGCVHRGILRDDNARWVREVRYQQVKVKNQSEEKTLLIFVPVTD